MQLLHFIKACNWRNSDRMGTSSLIIHCSLCLQSNYSIQNGFTIWKSSESQHPRRPSALTVHTGVFISLGHLSCSSPAPHSSLECLYMIFNSKQKSFFIWSCVSMTSQRSKSRKTECLEHYLLITCTYTWNMTQLASTFPDTWLDERPHTIVECL